MNILYILISVNAFKKPKSLVTELGGEAWGPFSTALAIDKELAGLLSSAVWSQLPFLLNSLTPV